MSAMPTLPVRLDGWTVADLYDLPDDGMRYELVDGALVVSPPPVLRHDHTVAQLVLLLAPALPEPWVVVAGGGLRFDDRNYRQPDLQVVRRAALAQELAAPGDVLLAVEVMSPSSVSADRVSKPAQYAAAGIPYFWRVELRDPVLVTHALEGTVYRESGRFPEEVVVDEPLPLHFPLAQLLG
ncbi:MAG: Uma2 family endonuclease [Mycobacteriales bacterium]